MADTPKHSVSVAGIVVDDQERVLVIQRRDNGHWEPPGGVLELDETPEQGVMREVLEETGLRVAVQQLTGVYKNLEKKVVALVFRCTVVSGVPVTGDETTRIRWIRRSDVDSTMTQAYAVRVADAFSERAQVRSHDGRTLVGEVER